MIFSNDVSFRCQYEDYLIRINFRADKFSRTHVRENELIFARINFRALEIHTIFAHQFLVAENHKYLIFDTKNKEKFEKSIFARIYFRAPSRCA